jgi:N-acyl-D-aspartate/D-glutamate deacylase
MVNRNDDTVIATLVAGTVVHRRTEAGAPASARDLAPARRTGRFLRVGEPRGTVDPHTVRWADQESSA